MGVVSFRDAFAESSNIAMATLGKRLEPATYYDGLDRFGLGRPTGLDLPGEERGIFHPLKDWTLLSRTSLPIGYEAALTGMQVISAMGAIGNEGMRLRPRLVREIRTSKGRVIQRFDPEPLERVASPETCRTLLDLMEAVVDHGTGTSARIPGYRVGGKTGTTRKSNTSRDDRRYIASFAGILPIDNPRLAIYVYVDEPSVGVFYGGTVAAPIVQEIALQATHLLGIPPNDPVAYEQARLKPGHGAEGLTTATLALNEAASEMDGLEAAGKNEAPLLDGTHESILTAEQDAAATPGPRMPDCTGLTMVEAWGVLTREQIKVKMLGSGVVVRQEPVAGARIAPEGEATLIFARPSAANRL
jgi:stage V sporulation protein D (sporulation-specific penicillin-binding protein)